MAHKQNCWEILNCQRAYGGAKVREFGMCKAATESKLNGFNGGYNGGRMCWMVAGTMCGVEIQGATAQKIASCMACKVYASVKSEERTEFQMLPPSDVESVR